MKFANVPRSFSGRALNIMLPSLTFHWVAAGNVNCGTSLCTDRCANASIFRQPKFISENCVAILREPVYRCEAILLRPSDFFSAYKGGRTKLLREIWRY